MTHGSIVTLSPPSQPIDCDLVIPGSKSYTNRALIIAALAQGTTTLHAASLSDDSRSMLHALGQLGVHTQQQDDTLLVHGKGGAFSPYNGILDIGPAGTTMRFLTALCSFAEGAQITLQGSERMHNRPIGDLVQALRQLGADITCTQKEGHPPLLIKGRSPHAPWNTKTSMSGAVSSQFFTALMLVAPLLPQGLELSVEGPQISPSYIDMTLAMMRQFGVSATNQQYQRYTIPAHSHYQPKNLTIEGDASGASYFWGLAAISGGRVRLTNADPQSLQGDIAFARLLQQMGCTYHTSNDPHAPWIEIQGSHHLHGIEVDMSSMPDTAQTLAVVAAFAKGQTHITGLQTLRHKETDRIAALHNELAAVGIHTTTTEDSITITGGTPHAATIHTYEDHRMAMAFALLAARIDGVKIEDPSVVNKSFPDFWQRLQLTGVQVK